MATFEHDGATLHYEETGSGVPLLALAPGGMRSAASLWSRAPFDPREAFADVARVITMDQRNAGASTGPIEAHHGWHTYAGDQLALLDHLGIDHAVVLGMCIGGPFCLALMQAAPERILGGVLLQPIGLADNREAFHKMFDDWQEELAPQRPEVDAATWRAFRSNLYDGDFVFAVDREFVRSCALPMLVLRGDDLYHPAETSEDVAALAPEAELIRDWKEGDARDAAVARIRAFLEARART